MAKILQLPVATTAPQNVLKEDAATFEVLRQMREDILCCALKPDQRLRFGELRQRYETSVGTLREALSHLVSEGLARTEAGRVTSAAESPSLGSIGLGFAFRDVADGDRLTSAGESPDVAVVSDLDPA